MKISYHPHSYQLSQLKNYGCN